MHSYQRVFEQDYAVAAALLHVPEEYGPNYIFWGLRKWEDDGEIFNAVSSCLLNPEIEIGSPLWMGEEP